MSEIAPHRRRVVKASARRQGIQERVEEAEPLALRLIENRREGRELRSGHTGSAVGEAIGTTAGAGLADTDAVLRVGIEHDIRHRSHRGSI